MCTALISNSNNDSNCFVRVTNYTVVLFTWLTVTYEYNGKKMVYQSGAYTSGFSRQADLPCGATNVQIEIFYLSIIGWVRVYNATRISVNKLCFGAAGGISKPVIGTFHCE